MLQFELLSRAAPAPVPRAAGRRAYERAPSSGGAWPEARREHFVKLYFVSARLGLGLGLRLGLH